MPGYLSGRDFLHRFEGNPIVTLEDIPFRCNTVFNGTPVKKDGVYYLLIRVEGQRGYSFFALATSENGLHFVVEILGGFLHPLVNLLLNISHSHLLLPVSRLSHRIKSVLNLSKSIAQKVFRYFRIRHRHK